MAESVPPQEPPAGSSRKPERVPPKLFGLQLAWLVVLLGIFILYEVSPGFRGGLPGKLGPLLKSPEPKPAGSVGRAGRPPPPATE